MGEVIRALEGPYRANGLRQRRSRPCRHLRPDRILQREHAVGDGPQRDQRRARLGDAGRPRHAPPSHPYHALSRIQIRTDDRHQTELMTETCPAQPARQRRPLGRCDRELVNPRPACRAHRRTDARDPAAASTSSSARARSTRSWAATASGKTTLAYALMGHPAYQVTQGEVIWKGHDILKLSAPTSAPAGHVPRLPVPDRHPRPVASPASCALRSTPACARSNGPTIRATVRPVATPLKGGIKMADYPQACCARRCTCSSSTTASPRATSTRASRAARRSASKCSRWPSSSREMAILDETDCGLDIDALRIVAEGVNAQLIPDLGVLLITHYQRLLNYIKPGRRPRPGRRSDHRVGRQGTGAAPRRRGLRPDHARGGPGRRRR